MLRRGMAGDRPLNPVRPVSSLSIGRQPIRLPNQVERVSDDDEGPFSASSKKKKACGGRGRARLSPAFVPWVLRHQVHTGRWPWRLYPDVHPVRRQSVQREAMERWDGTRLKNTDTVQLRARVRRAGAEMVPKPLVSGRGAPPRPGIGAAIGGGKGRGEMWSGHFQRRGVS